MKKTELLELINRLPEEVDVDQLVYTLFFRREINRGLAEADAGLEVSLEEIDRLIDEWHE